EQAKRRLLDGRAELGLGELDDLRLRRVHTDAYGQTHARFQQLHRGLPVWGGEVIAHQDAEGTALAPTNRARRDVAVAGTEPALSAARAVELTHRHLPKGLRLNHPTEAELLIAPNPGRGGAAFQQDATGAWSFDADHTAYGRPSSDDPYLLAYHVKVDALRANGHPFQQELLMDARSGAILRRWDALHTDTPVKATGHSQYNGPVSLDATQRTDSDNLYELRDTTRGLLPHPITGEVGNVTVDMQNSPFVDASVWHPLATGIPYSNATDDYGDGNEYTELQDPVTQLSTNSQTPTGQTAGVDAAWGLQRTWDFYQSVMGRNGIDDQGTSVIMRTHFLPAYPNAFWSDRDFAMTFGDGGPVFKSLTQLDVVGHELSHGVTAWTAGLYYGDESGGLNEANSDIFGTLVEFWTLGAGATGPVVPDTGGNWTLGEQIVKLPEMHGALRWMDRPSRDGISLDAWFEGSGLYNVHYSSGIGNRMFYFLSQGATPQGDTSSPYAPLGFAGIGNQKAAQIWYRTLTTYLTTFSDFHDARTQALQAATDLFGAGSAEVAAVENAFGAVNVGPLHGQPEPARVHMDSGSVYYGPLAAVIAAGLPSKPFVVTVQNTANQALAWTVAGGGSIDADGTFHAPVRVSPSKLYEVEARSVAAPLQHALGLALPVAADANDDIEVDALDLAPIALNYGLTAYDPGFDGRASIGGFPEVNDASVFLFTEAFRNAYTR
ncbi:MAG TPA: M4 family metallopeptidase, partial [Holophagaceae bacterium]|nr:M4 family metallopeptidase [Holophagaceae bacterium]